MTTYNAVSTSKLTAWTVPNAAALAAILPTHGQEGLVARAVDTGLYYELLAIDPTGAPTWSAAIGGGGGGGGGGTTTGELLTFSPKAIANITLSNGNLTATLTATGLGIAGGQSMMQDANKCEFTLAGPSGLLGFGFGGAVSSAGAVGNSLTIAWTGASWGQTLNDGTTSVGTSGTVTGLVAPASGDIYALAQDPATRAVSFIQKTAGGVLYTAVLQYATIPGNSAVQPYAVFTGTGGVTGVTINAGQSPWAIASGVQYGPMAQDSYPNSSAFVHVVSANITILATAPYAIFMVDTTGGNRTLNFPATPLDKQRVGVCNYKYNDGVASQRYAAQCHFGNTYKAHGLSDIWIGPEVLRIFQFDATSASWVEHGTANLGAALLHVAGQLLITGTDQELVVVVDATTGNVAAPIIAGNVNGQKITMVKADSTANTVGIPWDNGGPLYAAGEVSTAIWDSHYGGWVELTESCAPQNVTAPILITSNPGANQYQYTNPLNVGVLKACKVKLFIEDPANTLVQWTRDGVTFYTEGFTTSGSTILAPGDSVVVTNPANAPTVAAFRI